MRSMCIKKFVQICMSDEMLIPWLWQAVQSHCTVEAVGLQVVADRETNNIVVGAALLHPALRIRGDNLTSYLHGRLLRRS